MASPPMIMRIDSHQHFWNYSPGEYAWINADTMKGLRRDFLPTDLEKEMGAVGLQASVAVQARQSIEESRWLLHLADQHPCVAGVVGWVDLRAAALEQQLTALAPHPKFVGVRHVVQDEADDRFMLGDSFLKGIGQLKDHRLAYDILIYPRQLPAAIELANRFPEQAFVLDHLAKPVIRDRLLTPWKEHIIELSRAGNVWCKVSGMVTEARWGDWKVEDYRPYLDVVFEAFGMERLMFGSDWPVCLCSGSYQAVHSIVERYVGTYSEKEQEAFWGGNACAFYGLGDVH